MVVHGTLTLVVAFTLTSLSTVVVALRFYARYFLVGKLGPPDWVMLAALIATWGTPVVNYYQLIYMDYSSTIDSNGNLIVEEYKRVASGSLLTMWIFRLTYIINHLLIKTSILLFYNYVTSASRAYYWTVRIMLGFVILSGLVMALVSIFICNPPQLSWDGEMFYQEIVANYRPTQCINPSVLWLTQAAYNLATDCIVWLLPVPFFLNLRTLPVRKRVELVAIFSVGIVAISASAVRLSITIRWLSGFDELGLQWLNILIWSQVEQHSGIIAASMPFLRPIFRKMMPRSTTPEFKLVPNVSPLGQPMPPRPPIIPSPVATFGSDDSFRPPPTPLSPIKPEMEMFHTV
ncbi:hypothetical protein P171DRAFT_292331 [Karstenula rhodostoma CBS 690.94]|uniref:Rhodopsin domain-containing protein n=1 Tax=Karstenula rhodostoma CBS 690.94 TaxID=1392251 RepID=A0A9P4UCL1_9PLEO|nr:hypothetical protein P171DRAFT_292331 [Karstenula rhodostoma CBS 690.94]